MKEIAGWLSMGESGDSGNGNTPSQNFRRSEVRKKGTLPEEIRNTTQPNAHTSTALVYSELSLSSSIASTSSGA